MLMKIPAAVLGLPPRDDGEEREIWFADTESDDSDVNDDNVTILRGGVRLRVFTCCDSDSDDDAAIYPGLDISQTAIEKYNQDAGKNYEFVELVKASAVTTPDAAAFVLVIFKARQCHDDDDTMVFEAKATKTSTDSYDIQTVAPLHSQSDVSAASESGPI